MNNDKNSHIDDKFKDLIPKKTGFKIPENYFENVDDAILNSISLQNKITNSGFNVPNDYFKTLENRIEKQINTKTKAKIIQFNSLWMRISVAAVVLLTFSVLYLKNYVNPTPEVTAEKMVELKLADMSEYELASLYEKELENIDTSSILANDELEAYLEADVYDLYYSE